MTLLIVTYIGTNRFSQSPYFPFSFFVAPGGKVFREQGRKLKRRDGEGRDERAGKSRNDNTCLNSLMSSARLEREEKKHKGGEKERKCERKHRSWVIKKKEKNNLYLNLYFNLTSPFIGYLHINFLRCPNMSKSFFTVKQKTKQIILLTDVHFNAIIQLILPKKWCVPMHTHVCLFVFPFSVKCTLK